MKKRTRILTLTLMLIVAMLAGCGKKDNPDVKGDVGSKGASDDISLMENDDRVWLVIESSDLTKDSKISYAFKSSGEGQVLVSEYVDVTVGDASQLKTKQLWKYLTEQSQDGFLVAKDEKITNIENDNQITVGMLSRIDPNDPNASIDGLDRGILEQMLKENKQAVEELNAVQDYAPISFPIKAKVQLDSSGNNSVREVVEIGEERKIAGYEDTEYVSALSSFYKLDFSRVLTGSAEFSDYNYIGFGGKGLYVITRSNNDKEDVIFDAIKGDDVTELK